nr:Unknown [Brassica oleracea]CAA8391742.1 Unknown [Brassica oleracea]CAA8403316.1 Unknown [Brassica oleracea]
MYPRSSSKSTTPDGGDAENNPYDETSGGFSSLGSQTHHNVSPPPRQQHNPNVVGFGHHFSGEPSTIGHSGASSSPLFRHRSSPAGFYDQLLPTEPNEGTGFSLGQPNGGYGGGRGEERGPSRLKSEQRFSGRSSSNYQEHNSLPRISEVQAAAAAINSAASTSMSFGNDGNNWDRSSSQISFTIDERSKTTDFFTLETQFSMPQTSLEMARMESLMKIPEGSVPCRVRAKRGCATHPRSIAERDRRTRISGKLKKLQELVPNIDNQTSYAEMLDLAAEHIKGLQHQVEVHLSIHSIYDIVSN